MLWTYVREIRVWKKTLYSIGNGFDLHHGLNTSYEDFFKFFKQKWPDDLDFLKCYFPDPFDDSGKLSEYWGNVESGLAYFDWESALSDTAELISNDDYFRSRTGYLAEIDQKRNSLNLKKKFHEFIAQLSHPNDLEIEKNLLNLNVGAIYLNFNYTNTLQKYYGIQSDNILHIHGNVTNENIIFGHGIDPAILEPELLQYGVLEKNLNLLTLNSMLNLLP